MELPLPVIYDWLRSVLWPLFRVASMLMVMTTIGGGTVPTPIRLGLAMVITAVMAPVLPTPPAIELFSPQGFLVGAQQVLIGLVVGFVSVLVMSTFVLAGQIIGMQTSLGFASMVDPSNGQQVPLVGQFYLMLATLMFFGVDGHLLMIKMLFVSFETLPIGEPLLRTSLPRLSEFVALTFANALTISLSAATALLLINFSFGVMTRAAPQLNIFSIGFPVTMLSGLIILWLTLSGIVPHFYATWQQGQEVICDLLQLTCDIP
ncbi:flagellar biosynthetic protein FliR [Ferrimonas lipolytica]|uniref:Flagellar biosynthetic protein FliR n=1 Tax=Ferrimonas lipolytica TaxID=2724191 RepID=A0A6H1UE12_9GAMM|nr:flagellar biosynthetic protein FliR [Ferrimonas lipolytica]QIZ77347.1 flagellar type III secretion system protein FliR [Ferrimonas lipolytica]